MITLEEITAGTLDRLDALGRTEDADPWVVEVEDFVFGPGPAEVLRTGDGQVLLALADNQPVGVAIHRPHDQFIGGQLLSAVLISVAYSGKGYARQFVEAVVDAAHSHSGRTYVLWLVHSKNEAMVAVSLAVVGEPELRDGDYLVFVHEDG